MSKTKWDEWIRKKVTSETVLKSPILLRTYLLRYFWNILGLNFFLIDSWILTSNSTAHYYCWVPVYTLRLLCLPSDSNTTFFHDLIMYDRVLSLNFDKSKCQNFVKSWFFMKVNKSRLRENRWKRSANDFYFYCF